jgi:MFS family permease
MAAGATIIGAGLVIASGISELWQLYLVFAFIGCGLMAATVIPCSLVIANWFVSRRGAAMSGAFVGTSFGGMIMSPLANWIILNWGWRTAFLLSGAEILLLVVPVILLVIRTRPAEMGLEPYRRGEDLQQTEDETWGVTVKEAISLPAFWQIATIMGVIGLVTGGLGNHSVAYLTDLGHSPTSAAFAWSVVMGVMIGGKLAFGPIADRWGAKNAMLLGCCLIAISIIIVTRATPYWVVMVFSTLYGFACGAFMIVNALLTGHYLGMRHFGAVYGVLNLIATLGGAIGPVGAGIFFDTQATYLPVFYLFVVLMLGTAVVSALLKDTPRSIGATGHPRPAEVAG